VQGCIVFGLTLLFGFQPYNWALVIPAFLVMFLVASLFSALGITVASFVTDMQGFQLVMNFLVMPMFFLSGALYPLTNIPPLLRGLATIDPLSYGVDGMRTLLIHATYFGIATDVIVLFAVASTFLGFGSYRFTRLEV
jgi:ABC-2 type transport system permease protein